MAVALCAALLLPVAATADTIGGNTFTISTGSSSGVDTIEGSTFTLWSGGSSSLVDCGSRLQPLSIYMPTDLRDVPAGAQWEYWMGNLVENPRSAGEARGSRSAAGANDVPATPTSSTPRAWSGRNHGRPQRRAVGPPANRGAAGVLRDAETRCRSGFPCVQAP